MTSLPGLDGIVARWSGGDGRIVPPLNPPAGVDVITLEDVAAGQVFDALDLEDLLDHVPPVTLHVRVATSATDLFPDAPPERIVDLTAANRAPETFSAPTPAAGEWFVALGTRDGCRLATGDPDGTLGQSARLGRVVDAFASLGTGQLLVGDGGAGHAARLVAATASSISDVVTVGTPYGPVSLTVLDEAAAGDAWRLLKDLLVPDTGTDDADLARGRALVAALAEVDARTDPAVELRLPAAGIPDRNDLNVHAVFGVVTEPAVRAAITAIVASGLASRASQRAAVGPPALPTGVRLGLRLPMSAAPTDRIVANGSVLVELGGLDVGATGIEPATDLAVRTRLRIGARQGWLAGGPDPLRGTGRSREHALRALVADVVIPHRPGSTATATGHITLLDGRVFDVDQERRDVAAGAEPVAAEVRLLLSLAAQRIVAEATAVVPSTIAVSLRSAFEALALLAADGSVADAVEQLDPRSRPRSWPTCWATPSAERSWPREHARSSPPALPSAVTTLPPSASSPTPLTVLADLNARSLTIDAPAGQGRFGWAAHVELTPTTASWSVRLGTDHDGSPAGAAWLELDPTRAVLRWRPAGGSAPRDVPLWPHLDARAVVDALVQLTPALLGEAAFEMLRSLDETAKPVIDAAPRRVRSPRRRARTGGAAALRPPARPGRLAAPRRRAGRPAGASRRAPRRARSRSSALSGQPGELVFTPGVTLSGHDAAGALELRALVDTAQFAAPPATPLGRLAAGLQASVRIPGSGAPTLALDLNLGVVGAAPGRKALHASLDGGLRVFLRPETGADIVLYPAGPGLAAAAAAGAIDAANHALPFLLNKLAEQSGPSLSGTVGELVAEVGDLLSLRDSTPKFTYDLLADFTSDPVGRLESAATSNLAAVLPDLRQALDDVLPANVDVQAVGQTLQVTVGPVVLGWQANPCRFEVTADGHRPPGRRPGRCHAGAHPERGRRPVRRRRPGAGPRRSGRAPSGARGVRRRLARRWPAGRAGARPRRHPSLRRAVAARRSRPCSSSCSRTRRRRRPTPPRWPSALAEVVATLAASIALAAGRRSSTCSPCRSAARP